MEINVFVCYSHQDHTYLAENDLLGFLKGLQRDGINFWWDAALIAGEAWDEEIKSRIQKTHIALVLVSQWLLDSAYCIDVEINAFLHECRNRGLIILPIILSPCDWKKHEWLKSRQFLPSGNETIEEHYSDQGRRKRLFLRIREDLEKQVYKIRQAHQISTPPVISFKQPQEVRPGSLNSAGAQITADIVSKMIPEAHLKNIKHYLPFVLNALREQGLTDTKMLLFALATIRAETDGTFRPFEETPSRFNTSPGGHPFDLYDYRADLGNQGPPDGERFKPRGLIGLAGRYNYKFYSEALGLDDELVANPEKAKEPDIAAKIFAHSLKKSQALIEKAIALGDIRMARRMINGGSHGMDRFIEAFHAGERLLTSVRDKELFFDTNVQ